MQIFVEAGADLTVRNKRGESLLHRFAGFAVTVYPTPSLEFGRAIEDTVELFGWLIEQGCKVGWEDCEQRTALDVAAANGNEGILKLFQREWVGLR